MYLFVCKYIYKNSVTSLSFCPRILSLFGPFYILQSLVTAFFHGFLFPIQQKPCTNSSIRPISEVLWNVTLTPWVHSKGWFPASVCITGGWICFLPDLTYTVTLCVPCKRHRATSSFFFSFFFFIHMRHSSLIKTDCRGQRYFCKGFLFR